MGDTSRIMRKRNGPGMQFNGGLMEPWDTFLTA